MINTFVLYNFFVIKILQLIVRHLWYLYSKIKFCYGKSIRFKLWLFIDCFDFWSIMKMPACIWQIDVNFLHLQQFLETQHFLWTMINGKDKNMVLQYCIQFIPPTIMVILPVNYCCTVKIGIINYGSKMHVLWKFCTKTNI